MSQGQHARDADSTRPPTMEAIRAYFTQGDQLAGHLGIEIEELGPGRAKVSMTVQPFHLNAMNVVHGAATFALADYAFAIASNAYGTAAMAVNVSITYTKAVTEGRLVAEAREVSANPKLSSYTIDVTDDRGDLVAVFQGLAYRKKDPIKTPPGD